MALSTVDTNQIANGKVKNEDMVASTSTNPFRSNATSITQRPDDCIDRERWVLWPDYRVRDDYD